MTILAVDDFQRADQSGWGTASDGKTYTNTGGGTTAIASNHGTISNPNNDTNMRNGSYTSADMDVLCRITPSHINDIFGVEARYTTTSGLNCYKFLYYDTGVHINKAVSGVNSNLTNVFFAATLNQAYWMRIRVIGSAISGAIWQDGSAENTAITTSATDTSVTGVGGAALLGFSGSLSNVILYDGLTVTDGSSVTTNTRTIPATAALQATSTRTIPATAALQATASRTIASTAALLATSTRTILASAALSGAAPPVSPNATFFVRTGAAICYTRSGEVLFIVR